MEVVFEVAELLAQHILPGARVKCEKRQTVVIHPPSDMSPLQPVEDDVSTRNEPWSGGGVENLARAAEGHRPVWLRARGERRVPLVADTEVSREEARDWYGSGGKKSHWIGLLKGLG